MKTKIYKGFTLIELLIVIAIIGILASIVLVSLNSARTKANTAALKATLSSLSPGLTMCCDEGTNNLLTVEGSELCSTAVGAKLPIDTDLKLPSLATNLVFTVVGQCSVASPGIPNYQVTIANAPNASCNTTTLWINSSGIFNGADGVDADNYGDITGFPSGC